MVDQKVKTFLGRHSFDLKNKKIAVGVSGGPDSLALLHYLWSHQKSMNLEVMAFHLDHMFRGQESREEALFVQRFCDSRGIPIELKFVNVPQYIKNTGKSPQVAARECRLEFFKENMEAKKIDYLALGHHGDDQIETMLMRFTRGSTGKARAGIPFSRPFSIGFIIRPFLCLSKEEIEQYCIKYELYPRRDPSNLKGIYSRNRFRKEILPFLKQENPQANEHYQRFSEDLIRDEEFLLELTTQKMNTLMKKEKGMIIVEVEDFQSMPIPLQRRGIQLILNYLYIDKPASLSAIHTDSVISLMSNPHPSGSLDLPNGMKVTRSYHKCFFQRTSSVVKPYRFEISEPGTVQLPNGNNISIEYMKDADDFKNDLFSFYIDESTIDFPLIIRTRQIGDRMTIKGMDGTKKLKDIFIDCKVPLSEREEWPVVTDSKDQILWLPGLKKANVCHNKQDYMRNIFLTYNKY